MLAMSRNIQIVGNAGQHPIGIAPFRISMPVIAMGTSAVAYNLTPDTDATTSFFYAFLHVLLGFMALLSLMLTCLTRLVGRKSLVGLSTGPAIYTVEGVSSGS